MPRAKPSKPKKLRVAQRLETYRRKRDFDVTGEPAPTTEVKPSDVPTFMVHKHDATRLHYDLRLEMEGVLASWAVPKGPSYDPSIKRLAVQTEDHPLEYGNFEGRIPDGEYGAGDSIIWDRGTWDTVPPGQATFQRDKGHIHAELRGEKLKGRWHLVRTRPTQSGKPQWLFFKATDEYVNPAYDVVAERPESVQSGRTVTRGPVTAKSLRAPHPAPDALLKKIWPPMKATLSSAEAVESEGAENYVLEVKYDGYRGLAAVSGGNLAWVTRNGISLAERFPEIAEALKRMTIGEAIFDGEVVALDAKGVSRFQLIHSGGVEHRYSIFDLLWLDGEDLRGRPLEQRRELLESVLANVPRPLDLALRVDMPLGEALEAARDNGYEGLIAKRRGSAYEGKRSRDWLKLKVIASQEAAIVGYSPISNGKNEIGALHIAVYEDGRFVYAGKVGTGFTAKLRKDLKRMLSKDEVEKSVAEGAPRERDAHWVEPRYVAQVVFTEWTADGKMRHPAFEGLREDKKPQDCVREAAERTVKRSKSVSRPLAALRLSSGQAKRSTPKKNVEEVALSSPDKVLFPKSGITKADVFAYYGKVAEPMVRALTNRPLAFQQWHSGITREGIYRQGVKGQPAWATAVDVQHEGKTVKHIVADRPETLLWLANQNALTLHMFSSRVPHLDEPDWVVFDLDPGAGTWEQLIQVATTLKGLLDQLKLTSVPKTSGKRGLHVLVPMARGHTHLDALEFAVAITTVIEKGLPDLATTERTIAKRGGRLYLDAFQNGRGKTIVAPYSIRAIEGAPVSTPLRWSEVTADLDPSAFNIETMPKRLAKVGDLFADALDGKQRLPRFKGALESR